MPEIELSFLIATRNRRDSLVRCLRSIEAQRHGRRETVVVDDASSDGTDETVRRLFPSVRVIRLPEHSGIGAAYAAAAREASGDAYVNLDDDCRLVSDDGAGVIARYFERMPDLGVLCCRVEAPDGSIRHREIPRRDKRLPGTDTEVGYFLGGASAIRAKALESVGGYPLGIAYGSEENDIAFRLFKAGWRMLFTPRVRVVHEAIPSPENTENREANYARNEIELAAHYLPAPYAQVHALLWAGESLQQAARSRHLPQTVDAAGEALRRWHALRGRKGERLSLAETRRLSRLSGRTWY